MGWNKTNALLHSWRWYYANEDNTYFITSSRHCSRTFFSTPFHPAWKVEKHQFPANKWANVWQTIWSWEIISKSCVQIQRPCPSTMGRKNTCPAERMKRYSSSDITLPHITICAYFRVLLLLSQHTVSSFLTHGTEDGGARHKMIVARLDSLRNW